MTGEDGLKPIPSAALSTIDAAQLARLLALDPHRACASPSIAASRATFAERDQRNQRTRPAQGRGGADGRPPRFLGPRHRRDRRRRRRGDQHGRGRVAEAAASAAHDPAWSPSPTRNAACSAAGTYAAAQRRAEVGRRRSCRKAISAPAASTASTATRPIRQSGDRANRGRAEARSASTSSTAKAGRNPTWAPIARNSARPGPRSATTARITFDYHHNAEDTLDKIGGPRPERRRHAVFAWLAAQADGSFGSAPKPGVGSSDPLRRARSGGPNFDIRPGEESRRADASQIDALMGATESRDRVDRVAASAIGEG